METRETLALLVSLGLPDLLDLSVARDLPAHRGSKALLESTEMMV